MAIDLFAGNPSITGSNLFQVDKNPLSQLDTGIEDIIGKQSNAVANAMSSSVQLLMDMILGITPSYGPTTGQSYDQVDTYFANIITFLGGLDPLSATFDPAEEIVNFITTMLLPALSPTSGTNLLVTLVEDAATSGGMSGFIPLENLALDLIAGVVGGAQGVIDAILATVGFPAGSGTTTDINQYFTDFLSMFSNPALTSGSFNPITAVTTFITDMLKPTNLVAMLVPDASTSAGVTGFVPMENLALDLLESAIGGAQSVIDAILASSGFPAGSGTTAEVDTLFTSLLSMLANPNLTSTGFDPVAAISTFITSMLAPTNLLAPMNPSTQLLNAINIPGLDATKIVSGIFSTGQIPGLDATKIVSGVLNLLQIPSLPASQITSGTFLSTLIPGLDATKIVSGQFAQSMVTNLESDLANLGNSITSDVQGVIDAITGLTGGTTPQLENWSQSLVSMLGTPNLNNTSFDPVGSVESFITSMIQPTNLLAPLVSNLVPVINIPGLDATKITSGQFPQSMVTNLTTQLASIFTTITSPVSAALLQNVPVSSVGLANPNLLANPNYATAGSVAGGSVWTWDGSVSHTADGSGSVMVTANGTIEQLLSDPPIPVSPNQTLSISHWLQWSGVTGSGVCFSLGVVAYKGNTISNLVDLQDITNPAASSGWVQLSGTYTVPATNVDSIRLQLTVQSNATAGTIHFDDGSVTKTQLLAESWTAGLPGDLNNLLTQVGAAALSTDLTSLMSTLGLGTPSLTAITNRFTNLTSTGTFNASQLFNIANIPQLLNTSVAGIGGIANIGSSLQQTWDSVSGLGTGMGTLAGIISRLTNLTTGGLFNAATLTNILNIPLLPGGSIPALDASKIVTGVMSLAQIPTASLGISNISDLQSLTNQITTAFNPGAAGATSTIPAAKASMDGLFNTTQANTQAINNLAQTTSGAANSGTSRAVNFANYPDSTQLPGSEFNPTTYSGPGSSTIGVKSGATSWYLNGDGARIGTVHDNTPSLTDYQRLTSTLNMGPSGSAKGYMIGRCNAADNSFVYCAVTTTGFLSYAMELGCFVAGVKTIWIPATSIPTAYTAIFNLGTGNGLRNYQVFVGGQLVFNYNEVGTTSQVGPSNRFWGIRGETTGNSSDAPPNVTNLAMSDNMAPSTIGSFFRQYRANTGVVGVPSGFAVIASNFFDTVDLVTEDFSFNPANNGLTIGFEGTYFVNLRYAINNLPNGGKFDPCLYRNGSMVRRGNGAFADSYLANSASGIGTGFVVYCKVGDVLQPGFWAGGSYGSLLTGETTGTASYFEVGLLNRSLA